MPATVASPGGGAVLDGVLERVTFANPETGYTIARIAPERSGGELVTAVQHDLPVVICLFNDRGYGVLRGIEARQFEGRNFGVDLTTPDFPALATSMGVQATRVADPAEFEPADLRLGTTDGETGLGA